MIIGVVERVRSPSRTRSEFSAWWNKMYAISMEKAPQFHCGVPREPFDDSRPLVLTHCDINMRNIIVGDDGRLWLVDWAWAGFWPPWFEYLATKIQSQYEAELLQRNDPLWDTLIPFICGPYYRQEQWYWRASVAMDWA